ncbi:N-6 DNA methylase [Methanocalculus sp. MC3]
MNSFFDDTLKKIWNIFDQTRSYMALNEAYPYVLGILGLKSLSDRRGDDIVRWKELEAEKFELGTILNATFSRIEADYPEYKGWFSDLNYHPGSFGEQQSWNRFLQSIISIVSTIDFAGLIQNDPLDLHNICIKLRESIISSKEARGDIETPDNLATLLSMLCDLQRDDKILDPFSFSGITLLRAATIAKNKSENAQPNLFAQTQIRDAAQLLHLHMLIAGEDHIQVYNGDIIRQPGFADGRNLKLFDKIISIIPFGVRNWGEDIAQYDPYGRFTYGVPPTTQGDLAYLQHCIASLADDGTLVVGVPPSMLFRKRSEGDIRRRIIEADIIEAVIRLPPKLLYPQTAVPVNLLIIKRNKSPSRKNKMLVIDASRSFLPGRTQNILRDEDISAIVKAYNSFSDSDGFSRVCSIKEIADRDFALEVSDYITQLPEFDISLDFDRETNKLETLNAQRQKKYEDMCNSLTDLMNHLEGK